MAGEQRRGPQGPLDPESPSKKIDFSESYSTESLVGQSVLVTGGATGIGQGSAIAIAEAGAAVTIADINEVEASKVVDDLSSRGLKIQFIKTDVTKWDELVAAFKSAVEFGGGLDIVVPAAGIGGGGSRWLLDTETNEQGDPKPVPTKVLDLNLDAVFNATHLAIFYFKQNPAPVERTKQIIFVASMAGYTSMTGALDYCTSKWAVRGLFRSLRGATAILGEGKPLLRCNLIAPNFVLTPMTERFAGYLEKIGIKVAQVSDCTDVVLRMASDETVNGRACAVAADRKSFDLCDDTEGLDSGREIQLATRENKFGYTKPGEVSDGGDNSSSKQSSAATGDAYAVPDPEGPATRIVPQAESAATAGAV